MPKTPFLLILVSLLATAALTGGYAADHSSGFMADILTAVSGGSATTTSTGPNATSTPNLTDILQGLQDQVQALTKQVDTLDSAVTLSDLRANFPRSLKRGDTGEDVKKLQQMLADMSEVDVSTTVSGYYGTATESVVKQFQNGQGLKPTGVFDADTRDKLITEEVGNSAGNSLTDFNPMDLSGITQLDGGNQPSPADLQNQINNLSSAASDTQSAIGDMQTQISQLQTDISAIEANSAAAANSYVQPPTLSISSPAAGSISKTSAVITWTTSVPATSEVDYSVNSSLPVGQTSSVNDSNYLTAHNPTLTGLLSGTTYYYRILARDSGGVLVSSPVLSFTTLH